jgi:HTH-type transcriptional regulator / antitoxin HigA
MDIRPIRTEDDYDWALGELEAYFLEEPLAGTLEADRFDVLSALVESYEDRHWAVEAPDAISAIHHWMEVRGLSQSDLAQVLGSRSRASELLNRKRPLNLMMAKRIHDQWKMPAELLLCPGPEALAA